MFRSRCRNRRETRSKDTSRNRSRHGEVTSDPHYSDFSCVTSPICSNALAIPKSVLTELAVIYRYEETGKKLGSPDTHFQPGRPAFSALASAAFFTLLFSVLVISLFSMGPGHSAEVLSGAPKWKKAATRLLENVPVLDGLHLGRSFRAVDNKFNVNQ